MSKDKADTTSTVQALKSMWVELPIREKLHGFALVMSFLALSASILKLHTLSIVLTASLFLLLLVPIIVESSLRAVRQGPKIAPQEGVELQFLCEKLKNLETETKILIKHFGTDGISREFHQLFPYEAANAGGLVSRYASKPEEDAQKLLIQIHEIIKQISAELKELPMSEPQQSASIAPSSPSEVANLLYAYEKLLVNHGSSSAQAAAFLVEHKEHTEFSQKAAVLLASRQSEELSRKDFAAALAQKRRQQRHSARVIVVVGVIVALGCIALVWWSVISTHTEWKKSTELLVTAEEDATKLKSSLETAKKGVKTLTSSVDSIEKELKRSQIVANAGRSRDDDASEMRKRINELAPSLASGLKSPDERVKESALNFLYSYGDRLDPAQCAEVIPPLVNVLDANTGKSNRLENFAKGALDRISQPASQTSTKDTLKSLEDSLKKSKSAFAIELLDRMKKGSPVAKVESLTLTGSTVRKADARSAIGPLDRVRIASYCKVYSVAMKTGQLYRVYMRHLDPSLDPYLRIEDSSLRELAFDADSGGDTDAEIVFRPPQDGLYRIIATTFAPKETGRFELFIDSVAVERVLTKNDMLADTDALENKYRKVQAHFKAFPVPLSVGKIYVIDMKSKQFDAYLILTNKDGQSVAEDDDSGGDRNARIRFSPTESGTYRILATSYLPATGDFQLTVDELSAPFPLRKAEKK